MSRSFLVVIVGLALVASSCNLKKPSSSPVEGNLTVYCAESVSPAVTKIADEFMTLYKKARITVNPVPTRVAIVKLLNNETTLAVVSRHFNEGELDVIRKYKIDVDSIKVALDGVVVIVNPENPLPRINTDQLRDIFTGKTTSWNRLDKRYYGKIVPALESPNSGTVEFFKDRILGNEKFAEAYPCTTMAHVYTFVRDNRDAIGLISANWLNSGPSLLPSKKPAPKALEVAEVDSNAIKYIDPNTLGSYYYPYQAHIYRRYYPLTRSIFFLTRDFSFGLGSGFLTFAASAAGQKIFLDNGLVPATMPVQLVQLNSKPL